MHICIQHVYCAADSVLPCSARSGRGRAGGRTGWPVSQSVGRWVGQATKPSRGSASQQSNTRQRAPPKWRRASTVAGRRRRQRRRRRRRRPTTTTTSADGDRSPSCGPAARSCCSTFTSIPTGYSTGECAEVRRVSFPAPLSYSGTVSHPTVLLSRADIPPEAPGRRVIARAPEPAAMRGKRERRSIPDSPREKERYCLYHAPRLRPLGRL